MIANTGNEAAAMIALSKAPANMGRCLLVVNPNSAFQPTCEIYCWSSFAFELVFSGWSILFGTVGRAILAQVCTPMGQEWTELDSKVRNFI